MFIPKDEFYNKYLDFCDELDLTPISIEKVGRRLKGLVKTTESYRKPNDETRQAKCWNYIIVREGKISVLLKARKKGIMEEENKMKEEALAAKNKTTDMTLSPNWDTHNGDTTDMSLSPNYNIINSNNTKDISTVREKGNISNTSTKNNQKEDVLLLLGNNKMSFNELQEQTGMPQEDLNKLLVGLVRDGIIYSPREHGVFEVVK